MELQVLIQKYFISFFKKATGQGHLWINWGSWKHARIDPSNRERNSHYRKGEQPSKSCGELCLHPRCAHVLPPYLNSKEMLMGCRIPPKESHSPSRNQGNVSISAHKDPQLGYRVWLQLQALGKTWPALAMQELQNTWPIFHLSYKGNLINANELAKSEHPTSGD